MRLPYLLLTLAALTAAGRAAATSCGDLPWANEYSSPLENIGVAVPFDAHPWRIDTCFSGPPRTPVDCSFIDDETKAAIAAEVTVTDTAACSLDLPNDAPAS
ncbi:MAG TPA: hypothetical protein VGB85_13200, partial [Nannocystis sp.]